MLSAVPSLVGLYKGVMLTNLDGRSVKESKQMNEYILVMNGTQEVETWSDLKFGGRSLYNGANDGDVDVFGADIVCR